jgi:uncharacterized phage-associated protein
MAMTMSALNDAKFANTVLHLLHGCRDHFPGLTKLMKMLKEADFEHYRKHLRPITGAAYVALKRGPAPHGYEALLKRLVDDGAIEVHSAPVEDSNPMAEYRPLREPNNRVFDESELDVLDDVIARCRHKSGNALSRASHLEGPWIWAWDPYHPGNPIPYALVRWLDNLCDEEDLAQAARAIEDSETQADLARLRAGA